MNPWSYVYYRTRAWVYNRKVNKAKKETEEVAAGFWELYHLATTCHGRNQLASVVVAADGDEIILDPQVLALYRFLLIYTPYEAYSVYN